MNLDSEKEKYLLLNSKSLSVKCKLLASKSFQWDTDRNTNNNDAYGCTFFEHLLPEIHGESVVTH